MGWMSTYPRCGQSVSISGAGQRQEGGGLLNPFRRSTQAIPLSPGAGRACGRRIMGCLLLTRADLRRMPNPSAIRVAPAHRFPWAQKGPGITYSRHTTEPGHVHRGHREQFTSQAAGQTCLRL